VRKKDGELLAGDLRRIYRAEFMSPKLLRHYFYITNLLERLARAVK